jgi:two-component system response regulator YesN
MKRMRPISAPHVLVVDDDPSIREGLALALAERYVVHTAATGDEACAILRTLPVRAIVLDAILGDEHGLDLVDGIRTLSPARILILTGHSTEELAIRAVRANVAGYLRKPMKLDELQSALARLVFGVSLPLDPAARLRIHLGESSEKELDLAALAGEYGLSERHLRRRFQEAYGQTPRRYLTELRMRRATELLCVTQRSINQIAQDLGYPDAQRFARMFKRRFGLNPSEFRLREHRPEEDSSPSLPPGPES